MFIQVILCHVGYQHRALISRQSAPCHLCKREGQTMSQVNQDFFPLEILAVVESWHWPSRPSTTGDDTMLSQDPALISHLLFVAGFGFFPQKANWPLKMRLSVTCLGLLGDVQGSAIQGSTIIALVFICWVPWTILPLLCSSLLKSRVSKAAKRSLVNVASDWLLTCCLPNQNTRLVVRKMCLYKIVFTTSRVL